MIMRRAYTCIIRGAKGNSLPPLMINFRDRGNILSFCHLGADYWNPLWWWPGWRRLFNRFEDTQLFPRIVFRVTIGVATQTTIFLLCKWVSSCQPCVHQRFFWEAMYSHGDEFAQCSRSRSSPRTFLCTACKFWKFNEEFYVFPFLMDWNGSEKFEKTFLRLTTVVIEQLPTSIDR